MGQNSEGEAMRILLISAARSVHTVRWANALCARGHKVMLAYLPEHENTGGELDSSIVCLRLPYSGAKGYYLSAHALRRAAKQFKPDIVNAHYASGYGTLMRMAKLKNTVLSVWGSDVYDFPYQSKLSMHIIRKNLKFADRIASTSNCMAEQTRRIMGEEKEISITPFGVDLNEFSPNSAPIDKNEIQIVNVKALEPKYGIETLIRAVKLLLEKLQNEKKEEIADRVTCRIYGDGSQRQELEKLILELGLQNKVSLEGKIPHSEVVGVLRNSDVFCALSDSESFGVAAVEAAAVGLPVVVSDADGLKEVTDQGVTGFVVHRRDPEEAAKALEQLVLDSTLRRKMGLAGRQRVEQLYNWQDNVSSMMAVYATLINN